MDLINALIFEITEGNISYQALSFPSFALSWPMTVDATNCLGPVTFERNYLRFCRLIIAYRAATKLPTKPR
jgi:hypothetical protein